MKILLIRPPQIFQELALPQGPRIGLPLGLMYVAASLRQADPQVTIKVLDALVDFPLDIKRPRRDEAGFIHFGLTYEEISQEVADFNPNLVGISAQYTDFLPQAFGAAAAVKAVSPALPVVIGGNPATSMPREILHHPAVDAVVLGEGEQTFGEMVTAQKQGRNWAGIQGVAYQEAGGQVQLNPRRPFLTDLDGLPPPAYDLVDLERYFWMEQQGFTSRYKFEYPGSNRAVSVITSRGCPFRCIFCSIQIHMGRRYRSHSPEYVLRHLELLKERYGVNHIHFEDDNLTLNRQRFQHLMAGILQRRLGLTWDTPNGIRVDTLNRAIIRQMIRSGAIYITVGIESGCQEVNRLLVRKNLNLQMAEEVLRTAWEEGLDSHAFYVVGFPGETRQQIEETFAYATRLKKLYGVHPHLGIANPIENTAMYTLAQEHDWLEEAPQEGIRFHFGVERRFKRRTIRTPEFDIHYLNRAVGRFHHDMVGLSVKQATLLLLRRPRLIPDLLRQAWDLLARKRRPLSETMKAIFLNKLLYPEFFWRHANRRRQPLAGKCTPNSWESS